MNRKGTTEKDIVIPPSPLEELLLANTNLSAKLIVLIERQIELAQEPDLVKERKIAESGEWVPYAVKSFALDTARTDELVVLEGDFIHAWTDGVLDGGGLRFNNLNNDLVDFQRRNPIYGFRFWRLYLTHTAQAGKTLDLLIGRGASAFALTQSITAILENKVSGLLNSTATPLGDGATYTGAAFSVETYGRIVGSVYSDRAGTLYIDQRNDGTNWDVVSSFTYTAADTMGFSVEVVGTEARVRFTNSAGAAQTTFRLSCRGRRV